jgi:hypothetical protein
VPGTGIVVRGHDGTAAAPLFGRLIPMAMEKL